LVLTSVEAIDGLVERHQGGGCGTRRLPIELLAPPLGHPEVARDLAKRYMAPQLGQDPAQELPPGGGRRRARHPRPRRLRLATTKGRMAKRTEARCVILMTGLLGSSAQIGHRWMTAEVRSPELGLMVYKSLSISRQPLSSRREESIATPSRYPRVQDCPRMKSYPSGNPSPFTAGGRVWSEPPDP